MASDHDTSAKTKLTPSVVLVIDIPDNIDQSFYCGQVTVTVKDSLFQQSSPMRHSSEIRKALSDQQRERPIRMLFTDGGPDHRVNYPSVKLALIAMFRQDDLDYLIGIAYFHIHFISIVLNEQYLLKYLLYIFGQCTWLHQYKTRFNNNSIWNVFFAQLFSVYMIQDT